MLLDFLNPAALPETSPSAYVQLAQVNGNPRIHTVLEECQGVEWPDPNPPTGMFPFAPAGGVRLYWNDYPKQVIGSGDLTQAKVTVLEQPKYGVLKVLHEIDRDMGPIYAYSIIEGTPNGTEDRVVFLVEIGGKRIKVIERLILTSNSEFTKECNGKEYYIHRISQVVDETPLSPYALLQHGTAQGVDYRMESSEGVAPAKITGARTNP